MDSWKKTARNINIQNNILTAELKTRDGKFIKNKVKYTEGDMFHNINGYLHKIWIPPKIFQTHETIEKIKNNKKLSKCYESWKKCKDFEHIFFTSSDRENFMKKNFSDIYDAYDKLIMGVMKADLWRYCVIYHYGGIYTDSDNICHESPSFMLSNYYLNILQFKNKDHFPQHFFSAPKNSPILKKVIDKSVERIRNLKEFKGEHLVHYLTGPGVFTDAIDEWLLDNYYPITNNKIFYKSNLKLNIIPISFHDSKLTSLYSGQWEDGWTKERDKLLLD